MPDSIYKNDLGLTFGRYIDSGRTQPSSVAIDESHSPGPGPENLRI